MKQELVDNIISLNNQLLKKVSVKNFTLKDEKQRGVEYLFNIKSIEDARVEIEKHKAELQNQEDKANETN